MSLLRLLTTGNTLVGVKDVKTRYRVNRQGTLPRFGSAKNPFGATEKPEPVRADARGESEDALPSSRERLAENSSPLPARDSSAAAVPLKLAESLGSTAFGFALALRQGIAGFWSGVWRRLSTLLWRPRGNPVRAGGLHLPKPALQGELSLDKIKVVRNDLSDTDLEIARIKPPATAPDLRVTETGEPRGTSWGRLAGRVFGAGKT